MDACWSNESCFQKEVQMFAKEKREKTEQVVEKCTARPYTGNLLCLS